MEFNTEEKSFVNSITFLNETGDITITWDEDSEADVKALVAKKIKEGYIFFTMKRRLLVFSTKKELKVSDVVGATSIKMNDEQYVYLKKTMTSEELTLLNEHAVFQATADSDLSNLVMAEKIALASLKEDHTAKPVRRAKTPEVVVANQCIAFRPVVGG